MGRAKKKSNTRPANGEHTNGEHEPISDELPEGFRRSNPFDGKRFFFVPAEGATLRGIIIGRFERKGKRKRPEPEYFYQVRATAPCADTKDADGEIHTVDIGGIVTLDERSGISSLRTIASEAPRGEVAEVFLRSLELIDVGGGNTFWRWAMGHRYVEDSWADSLAEGNEPGGESSDESEEKIPF